MSPFRASLFATLLGLLFAISEAELYFDGDDEKTVGVQTDGSDEATINVISSGSPTTPTVSPSSLYTVDSITSAVTGGMTNYTITISMDGDLGKDDIVVTVSGESVTGTVIVAGLQIIDGGSVVSGDSASGVTVGQMGTSDFGYKAVGTDGSEMSISDAMIMQRSESPDYMELDSATTKFTSDKFVVGIAKYRVGDGSFYIDIEVPKISSMGMSCETSLKVRQTTTPAPPCVAYGGEYSVSGGTVSVKMFNLMNPPQASAIGDVTLTIGSESYKWDKGASDLSAVDQMVVFKVSSSGSASIECDGSDAEVIGDGITVTGGEAVPLAKDNLGVLPQLDGHDQLTVPVSAVESDPSLMSMSEALKIAAKICSTMMATGVCPVLSVTKGSAILEIAGNVKTSDVSTGQDAVKDCFADCTCPEELGYTCNGGNNDLSLGKPTVKAVGTIGSGLAAGTGLALWTIVLIAGLGAFALIALIMLGLLAVYRRSAEQSESVYSSSGPLGVPDPSDLLYEQSIVRDIYGRGDFPEGGPSAAVAEQRAKEADLREEFPRPPSSSGLSRQTDDASSTYSV